MMTFCGTCNTWVQAGITQPFGTPNVCGHAVGSATLPTTRQQDMWTTLLRRPAGYGAQYIMTEAEALGSVPEPSYIPDGARREATPSPPRTDPQIAVVEEQPIDADLVRCRACKKGYRWPMEASRTDEHHLCLRCEYKEGL